MLIGKPGAARTAIAAPSSDRIMVRERDLSRDLMGRLTFTDYAFLLATGEAPTDDQRFFLDMSLVALAEHGLTPSVQAARMTYDADPAALQGAIAAATCAGVRWAIESRLICSMRSAAPIAMAANLRAPPPRWPVSSPSMPRGSRLAS